MRPTLYLLSAAGFIALTFIAGPSAAQPEDRMAPNSRAEATVYRDPNFRGPAMAVQRPDPDVRLAWPVYSLRVARGTWQVCSTPNFQGQCIIVTRDESNLSGKLGRGNILRSIRPISDGPGGGGGGGGGAGDPGEVLRGMAAAFYPRPMDGATRVLACRRGSATANCAAQTADQFCRTHGWNGSARQAMETANRQVYLADVLCSRTGY
jgi:hypothetical protein